MIIMNNNCGKYLGLTGECLLLALLGTTFTTEGTTGADS